MFFGKQLLDAHASFKLLSSLPLSRGVSQSPHSIEMLTAGTGAGHVRQYIDAGVRQATIAPVADSRRRAPDTHPWFRAGVVRSSTAGPGRSVATPRTGPQSVLDRVKRNSHPDVPSCQIRRESVGLSPLWPVTGLWQGCGRGELSRRSRQTAMVFSGAADPGARPMVEMAWWRL